MAKTKTRFLYILQYLWRHTDEEHYATVSDIVRYLDENGVPGNRKTVADDINALTDYGFDIICDKSRQNQYFIGERILELPELKLLVDAVQASNFITKKKSKTLIDKLSSLTSIHTASQLDRDIYVNGLVKPNNENGYYTVDLLHSAIHGEKRITFKYYEYNGQKKKVLKHGGKLYRFSPYHMVWSNDSYYAVGYSESHGKVVTFRADRIYRPEITDKPFRPKPLDFDIAAFCNAAFSMYDSTLCTVTLLCENSTMKAVIDRFGEETKTHPFNSGHFKATVQVYPSPPFFAWVCTYCGKIKILDPKNAADSYKAHIRQSLENA